MTDFSELSRQFRAMNTDVVALVVVRRGQEAEAEGALEGVQGLFEEAESVMSRFLPDSALSRLNAAAGTPFHAPELLFQAVAGAVGAAAATGGLFDPTVLQSLIQAGYDRSFEKIAGRSLGSLRRSESPALAHEVAPSRSGGETGGPPAWSRVRLDPIPRTITLPAGVGLDLGGIGKGWTVDRAAASLCRFDGFVVDAGGDLYAAGTQADGTLWTVGVEDPFAAGEDLMVLPVRDRAVATSTTMRRRWVQSGGARHHLIDPRTGRPSESGVVSVTVLAGSVARAEVLAKVALLLGPEVGVEYLDGHHGLDWVLVTADGHVARSRGIGGVSDVD